MQFIYSFHCLLFVTLSVSATLNLERFCSIICVLVDGAVMCDSLTTCSYPLHFRVWVTPSSLVEVINEIDTLQYNCVHYVETIIPHPMPLPYVNK